jgi:hypothetical protein
VLKARADHLESTRGVYGRLPICPAFGNVRVEHGGAPPEGERVGGHFAELGPERVGVCLHEVGERVDEAVDDERLALILP